MCPESLSSLSSSGSCISRCFEAASEDFDPIDENECRYRVSCNLNHQKRNPQLL